MLSKLCFIILGILMCSSFTKAQQQCVDDIDTDGFNYYAEISPDESYIAFVKMFELDYRIYGDIWLYDCQMNSIEQLTKNTFHAKSKDNFISWASDGSKFYFSAGGSIMEYNLEHNTVNLSVKTDIEEDNRTVFAPTISYDGNKLAFWVRYTAGDNSHGVSYLDLNTGEEVLLAKKTFNPGTEVTFYNPQWIEHDSAILATYFNPENRVQLYIFDVQSGEEELIDERLYSTFFKANEDAVYYTKYDLIKQEPVLYKATLLEGSITEVLRVNQNAVFDVNNAGDIYYSRNDSTFKYSPDIETVFITEGSNPTVEGDKMVVEKWSDTTIETQLEIIDLTQY